MWKKLTTTLLCAMMFFTTFSVRIFSEENKEITLSDGASPASEVQIGDYYDKDGNVVENPNPKTIENNYLYVSKEISGTDTENEFQIDLEVQTKSIAETIKREEDAAVILVLDTSNSMYKPLPGEEKNHNFVIDMIGACYKFLEKYGESSDEKVRYVSLITYYKDVHTLDDYAYKNTYGWVDIHGNTDNLKKNREDFLNTYFKSDTKKPDDVHEIFYKTQDGSGYSALAGHSGTNTHGALEYAYKMLTAEDGSGKTNPTKDIKNKYVILMTDGQPNTILLKNDLDGNTKTGHWYTSSGDGDAAGWNKETALGYKDEKGKRWYDDPYFKKENGSSGTDANGFGDPGLYAAARAKDVADRIKTVEYDNTKVQLLTIGFGPDLKNGIYDSGYVKGTPTSVYHPFDDEDVETAEKEKDKNYYFYTSTNKEVPSAKIWLKTQIASSYSDYFPGDRGDDITLLFDKVYEKISQEINAWNVSDPMGENIQIIQDTWDDINDEEKDSIEVKNNILCWDLKKSTPIYSTDTGYYTYNATYKIKLNNLESDFDDNKLLDGYHLANGDTSIDYVINPNTEPEEKTDYFNVPSVEGYAGEFEFHKLDPKENPLKGAVFTLTTEDDPDWSMSVYSDDDGNMLFENIPSGHTYILEETAAPTGYIKSNDKYKVVVSYGNVSIYDDDNQLVDIVDYSSINTPDTNKKIKVTKKWIGTKSLPNNIKVNLYKKGQDEKVAQITINKVQGSKTWTTTTNYNVFDEDGNRIEYYIKELSSGGSEIDVGKSYNNDYKNVYSDDPLTVVNATSDNITSFKVNKSWNDDILSGTSYSRPTSIEVEIYGEAKDEPMFYVCTKSIDNTNTVTIENLPKYSVGGNEIKYTVKEKEIKEYPFEAKYKYDYEKNECTITNTPITKSAVVEVVWDDNNNQDNVRPESVKVKLYKTVDGTTKEYDNNTITISNTDEWTYIKENLPAYEGGKEVIYSFKELSDTTVLEPSGTNKLDDNYDLESYNNTSEDNIDETIITNKHTPEKISISTTKTWSDNDNQDGKRPESITINLLADGTKKDSKTVSAADSWSASFTDLPKYKDGEEIVYTITEDEVTDYTTTIDGYAITNSHTPEKISISTTKTWSDND
ncbi:MAG: Cna B-type domain-containing protein, partial [Erysipelotrichaceae bacterium]|nr:Cna B-type domain-containing protein [Erysipelotrichaceae bacterium]